MSEKEVYLHTTVLEEKEARRLELLNQAYGPNTQEVLAKYLNPESTVLELAVGTGITGKYLAEHTQDGLYVGLDNSAQQLARAAQRIDYSNAHFIQADVTLLSESTELKEIIPEKGFDLIYCRWLLCHIPSEKRPGVICQILKLLALDGVFICEEPDFRKMYLKKNGTLCEHSAIEGWKSTVKLLEEKLPLDLKMDTGALLRLLRKSTEDEAGAFKIEIINHFQPELYGEQKESLCLAIETSRRAVENIAGISNEKNNELLKGLYEIAEDPDFTVVFYENTFAATTRCFF